MDRIDQHRPGPTPALVGFGQDCACGQRLTPGHVCKPKPLAVAIDDRPMTFPTLGGHTVTVTALPGSRIPYDWECSAGHVSDQAYAVLSYCRDDAQAHAETCTGDGAATTVERANARSADAERHAESALSAIAYHLSSNDWGNARRVLAEYASDTARAEACTRVAL